jgi:hypothetical protein
MKPDPRPGRVFPTEKMTMTTKGKMVAAAVAGMFLAAPALSQAADAAATPAKVKCEGANSCKGSSSCKSASNDCKGQNGCKGKGWSEMTEKDCKDKGGKVVASK